VTSIDTIDRVCSVEGSLNYAIDSGSVNRFHAKNSALDTFRYDPQTVRILDGRTLPDRPHLDREGFCLAHMPSEIRDFRRLDEIDKVHGHEVVDFIKGITGADEVVLAGPPALRFGDRAAAADRALHSKTAKLIHSDSYETASEDFTREFNPHEGRKIARCEHHNIWRTFSEPPQDIPLALCDFRSISPDDIIRAEAAFDDHLGTVTWSFEAMLFRYNPSHRWVYFSNMVRDEVLVFKRYDTDRARPWFVPHTAFEDLTVLGRAVPRASIEMRTISYWYK
jgi:hypothetical protein